MSLSKSGSRVLSASALGFHAFGSGVPRLRSGVPRLRSGVPRLRHWDSLPSVWGSSPSALGFFRLRLWDSTPSALGFFRLRLWDSSPSALGFLAFGSRVPRLRLFRLGIMIVMRAMPESPESEPIPDFDFYRDSVVGINLAAGISLLDWLVITEAGRYSFKRRSEIPVANIMKNPKFLSKFAL